MSELKIEDVAKMVAVFKLNYNAYNNAKPEEIKLMIDFWFNRLKEYNAEVVSVAVDRILKHSKYPPTLATIIEQIELISDSLQPSEFELWEELTKAIYEASILAGRFNYDAIPLGETKTQGQLAREQLELLFNGLHPILKEYVVTKQGLLDIGLHDKEFEKNKFLKVYPQLKTRVEVKAETPETIKQFFSSDVLKLVGNKIAK